jgi:hypothetical protein
MLGPGAGFTGAGLTPAGFGSPVAAAINIQVPLPDQLTSKGQTGRLISLQTGDYVFTSDGRIAGMTTMQQLVMLALLNGNILIGIQDKFDNFQRAIAARVQNALNPYVRPGWIAVDGVDVVEPEGSPDAAGITVRWRDLTMPASASNATTTPNSFTTAIPTT